jgi:putative MATE family efflux protein
MGKPITNEEAARSIRLTEGPVTKILLKFALPTLALNVLQSINGSINAMWVGRLLGKTALGATSNVNLLTFMVFALTFGFGMASTIIIGQNMGRRNLMEVRRIVGAGVGLFLLIGSFVAIAGWYGMPSLLHFLGTPHDIYSLALDYSRVFCLGMPPALLFIYLQMALRGTGDSATPLLFIVPGALIDVVLNPIFILGLGPAPKMGIEGSAVAGLIASYFSVSSMIIYIYVRNLPICLRGPDFSYLIPSRDVIFTIIRKGFPMGLQMIIWSAASLVMMSLVNSEGTSTVAAYGTANQLWIYIQMPSMAIGMAVSAMAAQNIGAGRWDRIDRIAIAGVAINLASSSALVLLIALTDRYTFKVFLGHDDAAIRIGYHINFIVSWSFVLFGVTTVLTAVPRANGAAVAPLVIMAISIIPGRLGAIYLLRPIVGSDALWLSFMVGAIISTLLTIGYYRYGGWRKLTLVTTPSRMDAAKLT